MIVRALDINHDWLFGKGKNDYKSANDAVAQSIDTRLNSFLGDCFFSLGSGIDWFNLLGGKDQKGLNLAISSIILNSPNVQGIKQLSFSLSADRDLIVSYTVQTVFSVLTNTFIFDQSQVAG